MSDIARVYPPASAPGLISGTAASNAAGAGTIKIKGKELGTAVNADKGHDYQDDRAK